MRKYTDSTSHTNPGGAFTHEARLGKSHKPKELHKLQKLVARIDETRPPDSELPYGTAIAMEKAFRQ
jgi:hypothetical protein